MTTVVDLSEARRRMTPQDAFDHSLDRWYAEEGRIWEAPVDILALCLPGMSSKRRRKHLLMLQGRIAGYTPAMIANAEEKVRLLQAAELLDEDAT